MAPSPFHCNVPSSWPPEHPCVYLLYTVSPQKIEAQGANQMTLHIIQVSGCLRDAQSSSSDLGVDPCDTVSV